MPQTIRWGKTRRRLSVRIAGVKLNVPSGVPALQILLQPQSVALLSGHNLRLTCYAVGKSPVQYQWFKVKEEVSHPNSSPLLFFSNPVYVGRRPFHSFVVLSRDGYDIAVSVDI